MNRFETWFCSTAFWTNLTQNRLVPALLQNCTFGSSILELGAGTGTATAALAKKFPCVTSLEYSAASVATLARNWRKADGRGSTVRAVQADATQLPFAPESFSCAIAILVLHHLRSPAQQDQALAEIHRVLEPGGTFVAFEINDGWMQRTIHTGSTFVPLPAGAANARLTAAGFSRVAVDFRRGGFLIRAQRAEA